MSDLDLQDDDAVLRERLGRLASGAARSVPGSVEPPDRIRRRGTSRRHRRTAASLVSAGLAVVAVAGVVSGTTVLRGAPLQPAGPSPSAVASPAPTGSAPVPVPPPTSPSAPPSTRTVTRTVTGAPTAHPVPPPTAQVQQPWARPGAEFGVLVAVSGTPEGVLVTYTPRSYDPNGSHWGPPRPRRTATVPDSAWFSGSSFLAPGADLPAEGVRLTGPRFVTAARAALAGKAQVGVWIFHATSDLTSPVTGVQEEYRP